MILRIEGGIGWSARFIPNSGCVFFRDCLGLRGIAKDYLGLFKIIQNSHFSKTSKDIQRGDMLFVLLAPKN